MGRDKTLLRVSGDVLAARPFGALRAAGIETVLCIGGDATALEAAGLPHEPDLHPGDGPLGAILTALSRLEDHDVVVVLAGDLISPSADAVRAVVDALIDGRHDVAIPVVEGRHQWLHGAWRTMSATPHLQGAFDRGERAVHRATAGLLVRDVGGIDRGAARDVDTPDDLRCADLDPDGPLP